MAKRKGAHHRGPHQRLARLVVAAAQANPRTACQAELADGTTCGRTLAEHGPGARWSAGHRNPGQIATSTADYRPEVLSCNAAHGARLGNQRRQGLRTTRAWR